MTDAPTIAADADLLRQFVKSRDDLAFGRLMARHSRPVRRIAYRFTQSHSAADDVAQAAFLVLLKRPRPALRSARRRGSLLPWLAKVAKYAAANWKRAEATRRRRERLVPVRDVPYDPTAGYELADAVKSALACLGRRDRRIVELRHLSQMPWDEVARHAGTTPEAARKAGTRALSQLRVVLEKRGITAGSAAVLAGLRALTIPTQSAAATVATITTPAQIAQGVLTMFKLQTAATTLALALASGGLIFGVIASQDGNGAVAATPQQQPATQQTPPEAPLGTRATLSDGTVVELFAIGDQGNKWWFPDGRPAPNLNAAAPKLLMNPPGLPEDKVPLTIALRFTSRDDVSPDELSFNIPIGLMTEPYRPEGSSFTSVSFFDRESAGNTGFEVLVPVGDEEELGRPSVGQLGQTRLVWGDSAFTFSPLGRGTIRNQLLNERLFVTFFTDGDLTGYQPRATLILHDGTSIRGEVLAFQAFSPVSRYTIDFGDIDPFRIEQMAFPLLKTEMVRFSDLSIAPGSTTEPRVDVVAHDGIKRWQQTKRAYQNERGESVRPHDVPRDYEPPASELEQRP